MTQRGATRAPLPEVVRAAVTGGVDWLQVRERELESRELLEHVEELATAAREGARARNGTVRVMMNRRIDLALAADCDGAHLGFDALAPEAARSLLGAAAAIGVSAHSPLEVEAAARAGADYAFLAPIFRPLSKPAAEARPPLGTEALRQASKSGIPVLAQGGLEAGQVAAACRAGAAGVAVTGAILAAEDPERAAAELRANLDAEGA